MRLIKVAGGDGAESARAARTARAASACWLRTSECRECYREITMSMSAGGNDDAQSSRMATQNELCEMLRDVGDRLPHLITSVLDNRRREREVLAKEVLESRDTVQMWQGQAERAALDRASVKEMLKAQVKEAQRLRDENAGLQKAIADVEGSAKSELDKFRSRVESLMSELQTAQQREARARVTASDCAADGDRRVQKVNQMLEIAEKRLAEQKSRIEDATRAMDDHRKRANNAEQRADIAERRVNLLQQKIKEALDIRELSPENMHSAYLRRENQPMQATDNLEFPRRASAPTPEFGNPAVVRVESVTPARSYPGSASFDIDTESIAKPVSRPRRNRKRVYYADPVDDVTSRPNRQQNKPRPPKRARPSVRDSTDDESP